MKSLFLLNLPYGWRGMRLRGHGANVESVQPAAWRVPPTQRRRTRDKPRIASIGTTGETSGPHVHVELLKNGQRIDPQSLMR